MTNDEIDNLLAVEVYGYIDYGVPCVESGRTIAVGLVMNEPFIVKLMLAFLLVVIAFFPLMTVLYFIREDKKMRDKYDPR